MTAAFIDYLLFSAVILSYLLTYNVTAPSHIIRSVLVSYVCENPAMTAKVTPEGLYNHNVCTIMWHYTAPWMFGTRTRVGHRTLRQMGGSGSPHGKGQAGGGGSIVKYRRSAPRRVLIDGKYHQAVAG